MIRFLFTILFLFPLILSAGTVIVKTKAPHNRQAVFQYRVPNGYDKDRREMYRVQAVRLSINAVFPFYLKYTWHEKVILFGNAAEYAPEFPESKITYINPPDIFEPVANTEKIILPPHDTGEFSFMLSSSDIHDKNEK